MIGRGKPGMKRSTVVAKPAAEIKKKTVGNIFDEDHEEEKGDSKQGGVNYDTSDAM